jgi:fructosamine-3-kinase
MMTDALFPGVNRSYDRQVASSSGPPVSLLSAVEAGLGETVETVDRCPGGDINSAWRIETTSGRAAFLKSRKGAPAGEFSREAAGLEWLAAAGGLPLPEPLVVVDPPIDHDSLDAPRGLVLQWVEGGGAMTAAAWESLGRGLAVTHVSGGGSPGGAPPGVRDQGIRFADAVMPAARADLTGFAEVYAGRIESLARQAVDRGALDRIGASVLAKLADGLDRYAGPPEPAARLHGDLWSGNVMVGSDGRPWLIDPAAHGGHRELDLAMLELFGSPPSGFYSAYEEVSPLAEGRAGRVNLWQVQPLLVHAVLFGGGYGESAVRAARAYVG